MGSWPDLSYGNANDGVLFGPTQSSGGLASELINIFGQTQVSTSITSNTTYFYPFTIDRPVTPLYIGYSLADPGVVAISLKWRFGIYRETGNSTTAQLQTQVSHETRLQVATYSEEFFSPVIELQPGGYYLAFCLETDLTGQSVPLYSNATATDSKCRALGFRMASAVMPTSPTFTTSSILGIPVHFLTGLLGV